MQHSYCDQNTCECKEYLCPSNIQHGELGCVFALLQCIAIACISCSHVAANFSEVAESGCYLDGTHVPPLPPPFQVNWAQILPELFFLTRNPNLMRVHREPNVKTYLLSHFASIHLNSTQVVAKSFSFDQFLAALAALGLPW